MILAMKTGSRCENLKRVRKFGTSVEGIRSDIRYKNAVVFKRAILDSNGKEMAAKILRPS